MKSLDLVVGGFYRDLCQPEVKLVYVGLSSHYTGQYDFDDVKDPCWGGSICDDKELDLYIEPYTNLINQDKG
jgi:hypothetical protein